MANIELVIKIPEEKYLYAKNLVDGGKETNPVVLAIGNGIPLKEHGDLVDRSKISKAIPAEEDNCTGMGMTYDEMCAYNDGIDAMYDLVQGAKTIVKANKEEDKEEDKDIDR